MVITAVRKPPRLYPVGLTPATPQGGEGVSVHFLHWLPHPLRPLGDIRHLVDLVDVPLTDVGVGAPENQSVYVVRDLGGRYQGGDASVGPAGQGEVLVAQGGHCQHSQPGVLSEEVAPAPHRWSGPAVAGGVPAYHCQLQRKIEKFGLKIKLTS